MKTDNIIFNQLLGEADTEYDQINFSNYLCTNILERNMWRVPQRIERNQGLAGLANTTYIVTKNQRNMTKKNYQKPTTEIVSVAEHQHLLAGSVRNDGQKIFSGDPDPDKVDEGDQNTHPADSKRWGLSDGDGWDD